MTNFPGIKKADVARNTSLGNGLVVTIEERAPYARWCLSETDSSCYIIDESGIVFEPLNSATSATVPTSYEFTGALSTTTAAVATPPYGLVFAGEHFAGINALLKMLPRTGATPLGASLQNEGEIGRAHV